MGISLPHPQTPMLTGNLPGHPVESPVPGWLTIDHFPWCLKETSETTNRFLFWQVTNINLVKALAGGFFTTSATWEAPNGGTLNYIIISFSVSPWPPISKSVLDEVWRVPWAPVFYPVTEKAESGAQLYQHRGLSSAWNSWRKCQWYVEKYYRFKTDAKFHFPNILCMCN